MTLKLNSLIKVAFIQKGLMHMSFPQTDKPELEFRNFENFKGSNHVKNGPEVALKDHIRLLLDKFKILSQENKKVCLFEEITNTSVPSE